jgi:hypothetical protein
MGEKYCCSELMHMVGAECEMYGVASIKNQFLSKGENTMKRTFGFVLIIVFSVMFFAWAGPVQAYTVTGDINSSLAGYSGGDLWHAVLAETDTSSVAGANGAINNPVYGSNKYNTINHNWIEGDYVLVKGASGPALYSVGELDPRFGNSAVTLTASGSTYNLSGAGRSVTGVTDITVVHAADVWFGYASLPASTGVTVTGAGITSHTYAKADLQGMAAVTYTATYGGSTTNRHGPTLQTVLAAAGVNMSNMNQYVIATSTDGYKTILSMYELTHVNAQEALNYTLGDSGPGGLPHTTGVLDMLSLGGNGYTAEGSGIRSVITADVNNGRWGKALSGLEVEAAPVPVPPSLFLLAPGLAGLAAARRRFKK